MLELFGWIYWVIWKTSWSEEGLNENGAQMLIGCYCACMSNHMTEVLNIDTVSKLIAETTPMDESMESITYSGMDKREMISTHTWVWN